MPSDKDEKNEDKFNQVLSTSKENGGLLASIGLKKGEGNDDSIVDDSNDEDPHKKSDLFDTSKDKMKGDQLKKGVESDEDDGFDLGFGSDKKPKDKGDKKGSDHDLEAELAGLGSEEEEREMTEEQQHKAIEEQFDSIYTKDPELRKALEKSDVSNFTVGEKYQIIEAYMQGGGAGALQIELEDDDEDDEKALMEMTEDEIAALEKQFALLYASEPDL